MPVNADRRSVDGSKVIVIGAQVGFDSFEMIREGANIKFGYMPINAWDDSVFAPPPIISWRKSKRLIETTVDNSDTDVIEKFGSTPWELRIQGLIIDMVNHKYPSDKVKELRKIFEYDGIWNVKGQIFTDLGINAIYFKEFELQGTQGFPDTLAFNLSAKSTKPINFQNKEF